MRHSVIRADISFAYAVYALLDIGYQPDLPQRRVKITKADALAIMRDAPWVRGQWDGDVLTLFPEDASQHGSSCRGNKTGGVGDDDVRVTSPNEVPHA